MNITLATEKIAVKARNISKTQISRLRRSDRSIIGTNRATSPSASKIMRNMDAFPCIARYANQFATANATTSRPIRKKTGVGEATYEPFSFGALGAFGAFSFLTFSFLTFSFLTFSFFAFLPFFPVSSGSAGTVAANSSSSGGAPGKGSNAFDSTFDPAKGSASAPPATPPSVTPAFASSLKRSKESSSTEGSSSVFGSESVPESTLKRSSISFVSKRSTYTHH